MGGRLLQRVHPFIPTEKIYTLPEEEMHSMSLLETNILNNKKKYLNFFSLSKLCPSWPTDINLELILNTYLPK